MEVKVRKLGVQIMPQGIIPQKLAVYSVGGGGLFRILWGFRSLPFAFTTMNALEFASKPATLVPLGV